MAPRPLTRVHTVSPAWMPESSRIFSTSSSTISSAVWSFTRRTPGSPWMPKPYSISSSARVKMGLSSPGMVAPERPTPMLYTLSRALQATR